MSVSPQILGLGLTMSGLGTILLLLSYKAKWEDLKSSLRKEEAVLFSPLFNFIAGKSILNTFVIAIGVVITIFIMAVIAQPNILSFIGLR
jgi:hypothetical protein